jgi:hypothetical protein
VREVSKVFAEKTTVYVAPQIPVAKERNARAAAEVTADEVVLVLFDLTVFGSARNCLVAGEWGIFYHNTSSEPKSFAISYGHFREAVIGGSKVGRFKVSLTNTCRGFLLILQARLKDIPS